MAPFDRFDDLLPVETSSADETLALGRALAERLVPGDVVALHGDLGAGKTVLTKGICAGLGIDSARVNSPTFTLLHEYRSGTLPVFHFDAYRIERLDEFFDLGYEDYFYDEGISLVEWAEKVAAILPPDAVHLRLDHAEGDRRHVSIFAGEVGS